MADERCYLAYLVRLWTVHSNGDLVWRASAENAKARESPAPSPLSPACADCCMRSHHLQRRTTRQVQWVRVRRCC